MPRAVEFSVGLDKSGADPALFSTFGGVGTATNHLIEGLIDGEGEAFGS